MILYLMPYTLLFDTLLSPLRLLHTMPCYAADYCFAMLFFRCHYFAAAAAFRHYDAITLLIR